MINWVLNDIKGRMAGFWVGIEVEVLLYELGILLYREVIKLYLYSIIV